MRTALLLAATLFASPFLTATTAAADGLQLPAPGPDAAIIKPCAANPDVEDAKRMDCGRPVFEACEVAARDANPDEHWRAIFRHCLEREHRAWDVLLNETYRDLAGRTKEAGLAGDLKAVQRNWIAYRDGKCSWKNPVLFGNNAALDEPSCLKNMTAQRTLDLMNDLQYFP